MLGGVLEPALEELVGVASDGTESVWLAPGARAATVTARKGVDDPGVTRAAKKSIDDPKGDPEDDQEDDALAAEEDLEEIDDDAVADGDDLDDDDDEYPEIDEDLIDLDDEWDEADEAERHDNPHKFYE